MKKTLFTAMLAAALMGGQVFADAIPTATDAIDSGDHNYAGVYSETGDVSGGNVTIWEDSEFGTDHSEDLIMGGRSKFHGANGNTITMTGGQALGVYGAEGADGTSSNNTVIMSGGQVLGVYGAVNSDGNANNNTVIISGGLVEMLVQGGYVGNEGNADGNNVYLTVGEVEEVYGATAESGAATNNRVHLVGAGASVTVGGATYAGQAMQVGAVYAAMAEGAMTGNSIEIYGTGIAAATLSGMQMVNFHIVDGVLLSQDAMVSLTSTSEGLDLTGVEIGFNGDAVQDWSAFDGKSITLVDAAKAITVGEGSLGDVEIKGADGAVLATASLALGNEGKSMVLSNIKGATPVPEPTTGTLSLLALAGLCIRRRRK